MGSKYLKQGTKQRLREHRCSDFLHSTCRLLIAESLLLISVIFVSSPSLSFVQNLILNRLELAEDICLKRKKDSMPLGCCWKSRKAQQQQDRWLFSHKSCCRGGLEADHLLLISPFPTLGRRAFARAGWEGLLLSMKSFYKGLPKARTLWLWLYALGGWWLFNI